MTKEEHTLTERKKIAIELQRREFWKAAYIAAIPGKIVPAKQVADKALREYDDVFRNF